MNGVEFRTRHNDYMLVTPSKTSSQYKAVDEVEYPDVPPEVTSAGDVSAQVEEMRAWFKAWNDQDYSQRDYR